MARDEPHRAALKAAAQATRARIRRDRENAPTALKKVFTVVSNRLFSFNLNAGEAFKLAGIKDCAVRADFKQATGTRLSRYIAAARIEVADVLMLTTDLGLSTISMLVGYTYHPTFIDNYKRVKGRPPSQVVRASLTAPLIDDETSLRAGRGLLDLDAAVAYLEDLVQIYPEAAARFRERFCDDHLPPRNLREPQLRIVVDGARDDELKALGLWQQIRDLPFEAQYRQVGRYLFRSTVLFDLLREKSRLEGRKRRQRGVELARLALLSLEGADLHFGSRIHDLRALGWAWLGNAHRLALDFPAAAAAFEHAGREWSAPREQHDLTVLAHICLRRGALLTMRREYVRATDELDRSCALFRRREDKEGEVLALLQRAAIHGYAGKLSESLQDLHEASSLIDEDEERELAFAVRADMAITRARAGETERAAKELERARHLFTHDLNPLARPKLDWIDGYIGEQYGHLERAIRFYQDARAGFRDAQELRYFSLVSVDLMLVHALRKEWARVERLYSETVATIQALTQELGIGEISRQLFTDLRAALRQARQHGRPLGSS